MALTGLDIYKHLPKENCKECGLPTCLAFAMKVASGQAALDACPRITDEGRSKLDEASSPPQRLVTVAGSGETIQLGHETVMFRHDEKFHHPTAIAMKICDSADQGELQNICDAFKKLQFLRVGQTLQPDMVALVNDSGSPETMASAAEFINEQLGVAMVLISDKGESIAAAARGPLAATRPVMYCTGSGPSDELLEIASQNGTPLCVDGDISAVAEQVETLSKKDIKNIFISPGQASTSWTLEFLTRTRRAALNKKFRQLGCPVLVLADGDDKVASALDACTYICKYASIVVTNAWEGHLLVPILTTRQNIYTDPQKPVQVEPKLYDIGEANDQSPLLITTNFSLSYYSVESEVEASRIPSRILAVDTEGTSVLTAWAADKFTPETIAEALKACGAEEKVKHRQVIIPGHVAVIAAKLAEETGWKVLVGPKEASGIGPFLKSEWKVA